MGKVNSLNQMIYPQSGIKIVNLTGNYKSPKLALMKVGVQSGRVNE